MGDYVFTDATTGAEVQPLLLTPHPYPDPCPYRCPYP